MPGLFHRSKTNGKLLVKYLEVLSPKATETAR